MPDTVTVTDNMFQLDTDTLKKVYSMSGIKWHILGEENEKIFIMRFER